MLVTDRQACGTRGLIETLQLVLRAVPTGSVAVWFRDKDMEQARRAELGRGAAALCREFGAPLWVSADPELAVELGAQALQLPAAGMSVAEAQTRMSSAAGPGSGPVRVGRAVHDEDQLRRAGAERVDQVVISPVFDVPNKGAPLGLHGLRRLVAATSPLPVIALGGIDGDRADACRAVGAAGVACIRAVLGARHPDKEALRMLGRRTVNDAERLPGHEGE